MIGVDGVVVLARESLIDRTTPRADRAIGGIVSEVAVQERGRTPNDPRDAGLGCFGDALAVRFFEGAAGRALEVFPQFENGGVVPGGSPPPEPPPERQPPCCAVLYFPLPLRLRS